MGTLTTAMLSVTRAKRAMVGLTGIFFIQGFMAISWLPRIPEIIENLNVQFATWGAIVGIGGLGGMLPLLFTNQLINRFGSRPLIQWSLLLGGLAIASYGFLHSPWIFFLALLTQNLSFGVFGQTINSHSVVFQNRLGRVILGRFHGAWSMGAATSSLLAGSLSGLVPLDWYLVVVISLAVVIALVATSQMLGPAEDGHDQERQRSEPVPILKTPGYVLVLALGLFCAVMPEATIGDWGAILAHKAWHLPASLQGLPYTLFGFAMIVSRLSIGRLTKRRNLSRVAQLAAIGGAVAATLAVALGTYLSGIDPILAIAVSGIFWVVYGLATGPQVPAYFSIAGSVPGMSTAQVMARMSLVNTLIILVIKILMGAVAQGIGVPFVFVMSILGFIGAAVISGYVNRRNKALQAAGAQAAEAAGDERVEAFPITSPIAVIDERELEGR